jgi:hypothetical protein
MVELRDAILPSHHGLERKSDPTIIEPSTKGERAVVKNLARKRKRFSDRDLEHLPMLT